MVYGVVYKDKTHEIFDNWGECKNRVDGLKGVKYKKFSTEDEARDWIQSLINPKEEKSLKCNVDIYVDGSYDSNRSIYAGWAFVVVQDDIFIGKKSGLTTNPAKSNNIDGELIGVCQAMNWWYKKIEEYPTVCIHYDYEGIEQWARGNWNAKSEIAKFYKEFMELYMQTHSVFFSKVKAHSGNKWNDMADKYARQEIAK